MVKIIQPNYEILTNIDGLTILKNIETIARICYKSEDKITQDSSLKFVQMLVNKGHWAMIEHGGIISVKFICDRGCCYDKDTKLLTSNGFKFFKDINESDQIYSKDDNDNLVLIKKYKIINEEYNGIMHYYHNTQIDLNVTPNHNMWVFDYHKRSKKTKKWKFIKSSEMNNNRYTFSKGISDYIVENKQNLINIPKIKLQRGFYDKDYPELNYDALLFAKLLGLWITDGCYSSYNSETDGYRQQISISQTKKNVCVIIDNLLKKLNIEYSKDKHDYKIYCPQLTSFLKNNFIRNDDNRKSYYISIPQWLKNMDKKFLIELLDGIRLGDGSWHKGKKGFQIYTSSLKFAEDIVEIALKIGKCANIYIKDKREHLLNGKLIKDTVNPIVVSICQTIDTLYNKNDNSYLEQQYNGTIYCLELEQYHKLYVMRNGKSCWCGNSHEFVRHRLCSFAQESTRYCNYATKGNEIQVINPNLKEGTKEYSLWFDAIIQSEKSYLDMVKNGLSPQIARSVLPNSLKTEIVITANLREWVHIFQMRTAITSHPQMRELMIPLLKDFQQKIPIIFDNIENFKNV